MSAIKSAGEALVNPVAFATDVVGHAVLSQESADALSHNVRLTQAAFVTGAVEGVTGMVGAGEWGRRNAESLMQGVTGIDQDNLSEADRAYAENVRFGGEIVGIAGTCLIPGSLAVRGAAAGARVVAVGAETVNVTRIANAARGTEGFLTTFNNASNGMGFAKRMGMEFVAYDAIDQITFQGIPELFRSGGNIGAAASNTFKNLSVVVVPKVLDVVGGVVADKLFPVAHAATPDQTRTNSFAATASSEHGIAAPNVRATFTEAGHGERSGTHAPRSEENIISRTIGRAWDYMFGQ